MRKIGKLLEVIKLILLMPFAIANGNKKRIYRKIKSSMVAANLL